MKERPILFSASMVRAILDGTKRQMRLVVKPSVGAVYGLTDDRRGTYHQMAESSRDAFQRLWMVINGADSWSANPWVWAVGFSRVTP